MTQATAAEIARDLEAAREELRGRRDQTVADYDDRLRQLAEVGRQVESGHLEPRSAAARVAQILRGRPRVAGPTRAGRTTIGLSIPAPRPTAGGRRPGPARPGAEGDLTRAAAAVERRLLAALDRPRLPGERAEGRVELALLVQLRRTLERQAAEPPADPVLQAAVVEYCEEVHAMLAALDGGGPGRARTLVDFVRGLLAQLAAFGGDAAGVREQLQRARRLVTRGTDDVAPALEEAAAIFSRVSRELERCSPARGSSLLDDVSLTPP